MLLASLCGTNASGQETTAVETIFWNRDGSGSFPNASVPPTFDGESGQGILWKTKLPNWSNSSPIAIDTPKGPRVVLLAEPWEGYAPWLLCFDADSGKELWRRELDAVPFLPREQQDHARAVAQRVWQLARLRKGLTAEIDALYRQHKDDFSDKEVPPAAAPLIVEAQQAGFEYRGIGVSAGGYPNYLNLPPGGGRHREDLRLVRELGLMTSEWDYQGTWDGVAFPTPIADGTRIWTITMHNLYSCHDFDGNALWQVRFPPASATDLLPEQKKQFTGEDGRLRWPWGWPGQGGFSTSPIMVDERLISCAGVMVRCLDAKTGQVLWVHPMRGVIGQALGVPGVVAVNGEKYVVSVDNEHRIAPKVPIYRLSDGVLVAELPGITCSKGGVSGPIIEGDLIVCRPEGDDAALVAHRVQRKGNAIDLVEIWRLPKSSNREEAISLFRPAWRDGHLYNGGSVLDLRHGKWVRARRSDLNPGYYGHGGILIGSSFMSWNFYGESKSSDKTAKPEHARFVWTDLSTGKPLGIGRLPINPADGHAQEFKRTQAGRDHWRWLGAATPFAFKNRIFIRAYDFLWCIGDK